MKTGAKLAAIFLVAAVLLLVGFLFVVLALLSAGGK